MCTKFTVAGSNRIVTCFKVKMLEFLPHIFSRDFIDFFIRNYFCFLHDLIHKWLADFNIRLLDVQFKITDNIVNFDININLLTLLAI